MLGDEHGRRLRQGYPLAWRDGRRAHREGSRDVGRIRRDNLRLHVWRADRAWWREEQLIRILLAWNRICAAEFWDRRSGHCERVWGGKVRHFETARVHRTDYGAHAVAAGFGSVHRGRRGGQRWPVVAASIAGRLHRQRGAKRMLRVERIAGLDHGLRGQRFEKGNCLLNTLMLSPLLLP